MELNRRGLLAMFGSAAAALAVAKTLPPDLRDAVEQTLRDVDPPPGVSYQWNVPEMITQASQWVRVPEDRHGLSEVGGLILCERPLDVTLAWHAENHRKALAMAGQTLDGSGFQSLRDLKDNPRDYFAEEKASPEWKRDHGDV